MKRIKNLIDRNATGKKVLLLFFLTSIVYAIMLAITIPKVMAFSDGMQLLDMMPMGYDSGYIISFLETLGEKGRHAYLYIQLPVDMIYPLLFGISYSLMLGYFLKKIGKFDSVLFNLCFLPVIAGVADYLENFGIIAMINNFPNLPQGLMKVTNYFSIIKSMTTTVFFIVLIMVLLILGITTLKKNKTSRN